MSSKGRKIVIIGNGIAGISCARHIRKHDGEVNILVISGETQYFFSRTALMYIYMGHMKFEHTKPYEDFFWPKNNIALLQDWVTEVDINNKILKMKKSPPVEYDELVLATGSVPNNFHWPGQNLKGVQGLYSKQDLDQMEENTRGIGQAVVAGGGLTGIEMAEMLRSRGIHVIFLVRESGFWGNALSGQESELIGRHIREHEIDLRLNTELVEIIGDGEGKVKEVLVKNGERIPCEFLGLTTGVRPNVNFLQGSGLDIRKGIMVDEYFRTNVENVYAIGDCAEFIQPPAADRRCIEKVWYTGRMHGETLAYSLINSPVAYRPGPWFNSAKFLDLEFQNYGWVPAKEENGMASFYWEEQTGKRAFRAVFERSSGVILGVNTFGWRLRHHFFDQALREKWTLDKVMTYLEDANFDTEFSQNWSRMALAAYNKMYGKSIRPKRKSRILAFFNQFSQANKAH